MLYKSFFANAIAILFYLVLISDPVSAQSASYLDSLDGKFALQFQIETFIRLVDFQGATLSGKYNFSNRDAVRLGISIGGLNTDKDNDINKIDSTRVYYQYGNNDLLDIKLNTQYIRYLLVDNDLSMFVGGGPFMRLFSSGDDYKVIRYGKEENWSHDNNGFSLGVEVIVGVEWMFYKNMTLSAEYGINASYTKSNTKDVEGETIRESTSKSYNINYNRVKFGLSVYF